MKATDNRTITRIREGERAEAGDVVAIEKRLRVLANGRELFSLYCSPVMIRELVTGFIMTEGLLKKGFCAESMGIVYGDEIVVDVIADEDVPVQAGAPVITSGCAGGITYEKFEETGQAPKDVRIRFDALRELFTRFQQASSLYRLTGCVHSAALSDGESILCLAEDVGRHNAVDKVVGFALLEDIPLSDKILLSSGRLSSEIAGKCARWGIPVVASRTAATSRAIDIALKAGITMAGFLRGKGANIYSHPDRII
jgi:FdhD protein